MNDDPHENGGIESVRRVLPVATPVGTVTQGYETSQRAGVLPVVTPDERDPEGSPEKPPARLSHGATAGAPARAEGHQADLRNERSWPSGGSPGPLRIGVRVGSPGVATGNTPPVPG